MKGYSLRRFFALLRKEWIQVGRDAMTLRIIIAIPIMQLFLFGYAINSDPKNLPTGLLSSDHSKYERTIVAALKNSGYYNIVPLASEAEAEAGLAGGDHLHYSMQVDGVQVNPIEWWDEHWIKDHIFSRIKSQ